MAACCIVCLSAKNKISLRPDTILQPTWDSIGEIGKTDKAKFIYNVDFATYFDNREYHAPYQIAQTIFNFRLSPTIGIRLQDRLGGNHELVAGVHYTQPLGGNWSNVHLAPTAYYKFNISGFKMQLGAIPYTERIYTLPDYLMYDSIVYMQPNIQGALISYTDQRGYIEFMCDWRSSQAVDRREMFRLLINGQYRYRWLQIGGLAQMNHKANPSNAHEGVCDDAYIVPQIGVDLSKYACMDSLALRVSYIVGIQRMRVANDNRTPQGVYMELFANWWFIGLRNTLYIGDNLMPFYNNSDYTFDALPYRSRLNQGDPFFQSRLYNRTDIFAYLYRNNFVNCYLSWNMHYDGHTLAHQQQLNIRFCLNGMRSPHKLRNILDK